jgi:hypothetical protein
LEIFEGGIYMSYALLIPKGFQDEALEQMLLNDFSTIKGNDFKDSLFFEESIWQEFRESWNNLGVDNYMNDGGQYRSRLYSVFEYSHTFNKIIEKPGEPHYQYKQFNELNGGIKRYFAPMEDKTKSNLIFVSILDFCVKFFDHLKSDRDWHIEVHQFRIKANTNFQGLPTPEGIHRDGVTYTFIMLAGKENIVGGESHVYDDQKNYLLSYMLENSLDCAFLDDPKLMHSVSPIKPLSTQKEAYRDTLVITFTEM